LTRGPLLLVSLAALAAGAVAAWLAAARTFEPYQTADAPLAVLVGWTFVASGLIAWRQRPGNRLGPAMVATGFAWFATFLTDAHAGWAFTLGTAVQSVYLVVFVYLVLSFPTGRLRGRLDVAVVAAGLVLVTIVEWVFSDSDAVLCADCPSNALLVDRDDSLATRILEGQRLGGVLLAALTVTLLVRRWRPLSSLDLKQAGVGLSVAILLDATIVRAVLLPASMKLLGEWNWYLPRSLRRIVVDLFSARSAIPPEPEGPLP
jgi:hypothetical protein